MAAVSFPGAFGRWKLTLGSAMISSIVLTVIIDDQAGCLVVKRADGLGQCRLYIGFTVLSTPSSSSSPSSPFKSSVWVPWPELGSAGVSAKGILVNEQRIVALSARDKPVHAFDNVLPSGQGTRVA